MKRSGRAQGSYSSTKPWDVGGGEVSFLPEKGNAAGGRGKCCGLRDDIEKKGGGKSQKSPITKKR